MPYVQRLIYLIKLYSKKNKKEKSKIAVALKCKSTFFAGLYFLDRFPMAFELDMTRPIFVRVARIIQVLHKS